MHILLNHSSMIPIYEQLVDQIRNAIVRDELPAGTALPSVRSLAAELRISALTVKKAYDQLEEQGLVATVHGKGSYVSGKELPMLQETRHRLAEEGLAAAVERAASAGLTADEIRTALELILEEL